MTKILVAVSDRRPENYERILQPDILEKIKGLGDVDVQTGFFFEDDPAPFGEYLKESRPEVLVTSWFSPLLTQEFYEAAGKSVKYVCHLTGGIRGAVEKSVIEDGVIVSNWGNSIARTIAEGALMMTLAALRKITWYIPYMQDGGYWNPPVQGDSLFERKVGLHGLGGIAQEFVKLLKPFGCDISAYSPNCPDEVLTELGVKRQNDLAALYAENDVVSVHAALTEKTRGMVTKEILSGMQENAVLVNTARGAVIDEAALTDLVLAGKIWAALDVFENEPLAADSPLRNCDRCLVMPHVAGPTLDRMRDMGLQALANLTRYVNGEEVLDTISARKYDLMT